ncbi:MAG: outer membrane beta-barrel protein [Gemmatimonadaceae bacterium]
MNRIVRLVGIAVCAALPAVSQAQTSTARPVSFGVMGGASVPMGDLGDAVDLGYTLGAHVLLSPSSLPKLGFRADVTYDSWKEKGILNSAANATTRNIGVMGNVILKSSSAMAIKPYVIGGLGLVNSKRSGSIAGVSVNGASESNLGAQVGGGLEFQLSGFTTFIEAKFVNAFADKSVNWIPVTFGIRF